MFYAFFASSFRTRLAARAQVWILVLYGLMTTMAKVAIWNSLFAQMGTHIVAGIAQSEMMTYAILAGFVFNWDYTRFIQTFGNQIKSGDIAMALVKPVRYPLLLLAGECGNFAFGLLMVQLPIAVLAGVAFGIHPPQSLLAGLLTIVLWFMGFVILFLLSAIAAVLAFWLLTVFSLEWTLMSLITIFAGGAVPLWFFPTAVAGAIKLLPFSFVAYHPMAVYLGKVDTVGVIAIFALSSFWIVSLAGAFAILWRAGQRRIVVNGG